jgi:ribosomal protein S18 acetylase RimI-like enzyme
MEITIRKGTIEDTEKLIQLLQEVRQGMSNQEWLYLDAPEDVRQAMTDGTMQLWVAEDGVRFAGIFFILIPGLAEYNYGYDLGLSRDELLSVVHMDTVAVHPDYRGLGLQKRLMQEAEKYSAELGERILLATVHPDNRYSLENFLRQGYTIERQLPKYGSVRCVLRKDIYKK